MICTKCFDEAGFKLPDVVNPHYGQSVVGGKVSRYVDKPNMVWKEYTPIQLMVSYVWFRTNISIQLQHSAYATSANKICTNRTEKAKQTLACIRSSNAMLDKRPCPNGVASHRELKTSDNLRLRLATTWPYLGWLAITCVNFNSAQICLQVNEIFSPSGHLTPSRRKLVWVLF